MPTALIDGDVLHHWCMWKTTDLEGYQENFNRTLEEWLQCVYADEYFIALGTDNNFRTALAPNYKQTASRSAARLVRPAHEDICKLWLYKQKHTMWRDWLEADDILATMLTEMGEEAVVVTVDKDLLQVPGQHFNPKVYANAQKAIKNGASAQEAFRTHPAHRFVTVEEAATNFMYQMLIGDGMDNIRGVAGIGKDKAIPIVKAKTPIRDVYLKRYGEEKWHSEFMLNGKLLYLLRHASDGFTEEVFNLLEESYFAWTMDTGLTFPLGSTQKRP